MRAQKKNRNLKTATMDIPEEILEEIQYRSAGLDFTVVDPVFISGLLKGRARDAHKGTYGHALLIVGSTGMMGAAVLSTGGALKSGCGLVSVHVPFSERAVIQISHPSAIVDCDPAGVFSEIPENLSRYTVIGTGCGLGQSQECSAALKSLLNEIKRQDCAHGLKMPSLVLDADALNIISSHPEMFSLIPPSSVLTPHIGELSRLLRSALSAGIIRRPSGQTDDRSNDRYPWHDRKELTLMTASLAEAIGSVIVVKGPGTMVCLPDRKLYFNTTGNPGMAKGGSGDILTGLLTGLRARGYQAHEAAVLAVWFHGLAGDRAAAHIGQESMNAADILSDICIR